MNIPETINNNCESNNNVNIQIRMVLSPIEKVKLNFMYLNSETGELVTQTFKVSIYNLIYITYWVYINISSSRCGVFTSSQ